jgi:P4 family phage/plasmid primase-like protien
MNKLNLTLTRENTVISDIVLYEPVDEILLNKLVHSKKVIYGDDTSKQIQLSKYSRLMQDGVIPVHYSKPANNPFGRSNPDGALSLFSIKKEIRHTLARENFIDIDIENCHPTLLLQICEANNIECSLLKQYVINREQYLQLVMQHYQVTRDDAKELFIRILYNGSIKQWRKDFNVEETIDELPTIQQFKDEFSTIANIIVEYNPELRNTILEIKGKENKNVTNLVGSVCSYYLQEYEHRILNELFLYCQEQEIIQNNICVLCADGIMLQQHLFKPELLQTFKELIISKLGFNLNFIVKDMNNGFDINTLDDTLCFDIYSPCFSSGLLADYFKLHYTNKFVCCREQLYVYNGVYWVKDDNKNTILNNFVDREFYLNLIGYTTKHINEFSFAAANAVSQADKDKYNSKVEKLNELLKNIQMLRKVKHRELIVKDILCKLTNNNIQFDSNPFLFCFNNKIYNLKDGCFIEPHYKQYISITTGYNYNTFYSKKRVDELNELFSTIFPQPEIKEYYLTILSTGLYGQQVENCFVANGQGGNGKSLINSLMMSCCGNYAYKLPSNVLLQEIKEGGNPQIANMDNKRFVLVQEPNGKRRICSSTLKELTGDRTLNTRKLHSNDCGITLRQTLVLECNDLPQIDEVNDAITRRIRVIPFISKFLSSEDFDKAEDKTNTFLANPFYKTDEFQEQYKQALFEILKTKFTEFHMNGFTVGTQPQQCKEKSTNYLACNDDIYEWFSSIYEPSNDKSAVIKVAEVFEQFQNSVLYNNLSKSDKRKYTQRYFTEKIQTNVFLSKFVKPKDTTYNKVKYRVPFIIGFKLMEEENIKNNDNFIDI